MPKKWVIFDADNTLWDVELLYDLARGDLCALLAEHGQDATEVEEFQQRRDAELHKVYGYSACRFARSFEDTAMHFLPNASAKTIRHVRQIALDVFERRAQVAEGTEEVVDHLTAANYMLAIITAGERWVQERRLTDFHLRGKFAAVDIVETKNEHVFRSFCQNRDAAPSCTWVVGDSLASDALPAKAAGLNAVLLRSNNWSRVEGTPSNCPADIPTIANLRELLSVPGILEPKRFGD